jgi:hypothetical protein
MPTDIPLMKRPTINMALFCEVQIITDPIHLSGMNSRQTDQSTCLPDDRADLNGSFPSEPVGQQTRNDGAQEGTAGHRSSDAALHTTFGTGAVGAAIEAWTFRTLVEIASILLSAQSNSVTNEGDVEEDTTYRADIDEMSKPNRPPPITEMAVIT